MNLFSGEAFSLSLLKKRKFKNRKINKRNKYCRGLLTHFVFSTHIDLLQIFNLCHIA